jgi:ATP-dependent Clp protease adaptor protein ClpS
LVSVLPRRPNTSDATHANLRNADPHDQIYHPEFTDSLFAAEEFVMEVLEGIFNKSPAEAFRIMMLVHTRGHGVCGAYPHEVAETKVVLVHDRAKESGYPLRASMEEA